MSLTKVTYSMIQGSPANVLDFGADPTGATDSTAAIQAAIDSGAGAVYLPTGTYNYSSTINISGPVVLYGEGTLNETTLLTAGIIVTSVNGGVHIQGLTFTGPETLAAWNDGGAVYRQSFKSFIKFVTSKNCVVRDIISSGKRGTVFLDNCQKMTIENVRHNGFLGDVTAPPAADSNYYEVIHVDGGLNNYIANCEGYWCGNVVLIGNESSYNVVTGITGREISDSLIYNSSGDHSTFENSTVLNCTTGLLIRGSGHAVYGNVIAGSAVLASAISLTGNGSTPDSYNANGYGTECSGNTIVAPAGHAIIIDSQDGLYPRDFIVSNNTIEAHAGTGGFAAISVSAERGIKIVNNSIVGSAADYAMAVFGPGPSNRSTDMTIVGNTITANNEAIRMTNVDQSLVSNNMLSIIDTNYALQARLCDNNLCTTNIVNDSTAQIVFSSNSGEECYDNVITINKSAISASSVDNTVANNYT